VEAAQDVEGDLRCVGCGAEAAQGDEGEVDGSEDVMATRDSAVLIVQIGRGEKGGSVEDAEGDKVEGRITSPDVLEEGVDSSHETKSVVDAIAAEVKLDRGGAAGHVLG
jgi:hypothetical protein